ncbi:MAG: PEGA domain-containing protein [Lentisphaeria bacterium]|nr:PEGA domain-containing protein [Lentisphaeria bacterium]
MNTWTMQMKQIVPMLSRMLGVLLVATGLHALAAAAQANNAAQGAALEPGKPVEVTLPTPGTVVVTPPAIVGEGVQTQRVTVEVQTVVPPKPAPVTKAVLVVQNHAQAEYRDFLSGMADLLTTELSNRNFQIINPANVAGVTQNTTPEGEVMPASAANRLAQTLGADYLITASLRRITSRKRGADPATAITTLNMSLSLNLANGQDGATIGGETVTVSSPQLTPAGLANNTEDVLHDMLEEAVVTGADWLSTRVAARIPAQAPAVNLVAVQFNCNMPGADIQIDGVSYGTVPATLRVAPGLHNVVVSYPYCVPFVRQAMLTEGQVFNVVLELDATGLARWQDQEMFDTIVKRIKESGATDDYVRTVLADGNAKFLSESHFRWDGALQTLTVTRDGVPPVVYGPTTVLQK